MTPELKQKIARLPRLPGVYQHKDADGNVLYVGKAKDLRNRVRSWFRDHHTRDGRLRIMIGKTTDVEAIVTDTEAEALILENNLIKHLKPRYNVLLRDDKTFPFICIRKEPFPRVFPTRRIVRDGSKYFGPYTDVKNMRLMLGAIRSVFQLRTCALNLAPEPIAAGKYDPCLEYHIKKCAAPCIGRQSEAEYDRTIEQVEKLLNGHTKALISLLRDEMERLSENMQFEEAAGLRDRILALEKYARKQKVVSEDEADRDLFALTLDERENVACGVVFQVREGKVIGRRHTYIHPTEGLPDTALMQRLVEDYYAEAAFFPGEVLLSHDIAEPEAVKELLLQRRGKKVPLAVPQRGPKAKLMGMVHANAAILLDEWKMRKTKRGEDRIPHAVRSLEKDLRLQTLPRRIECFDISHLAGAGTVASCVVFRDGRPRKSEYRRYKIRCAVPGKPDDYQSMREVVARRYAKREDIEWPDLVVIDGGKGQLSAATDALRTAGAYGKFPVVGLAKRLEEVFFPGNSEALHIPKASTSLQLLQRIRNEAHRFAVAFQRTQRKKKVLHSSLREIDGVGEKTAQKLIRRFGSAKQVEAAGEEALRDAVGPAAARKIAAFFEAKNGGATSGRSA